MDFVKFCLLIVAIVCVFTLAFVIEGYFFMFIMWTVGFNVPFWKCIWCSIVLGIFNFFVKKALGA